MRTRHDIEEDISYVAGRLDMLDDLRKWMAGTHDMFMTRRDNLIAELAKLNRDEGYDH